MSKIRLDKLCNKHGKNKFNKLVEVSGSWSSELDPKGIKKQNALEKKIEEAMHELTVDRRSNGFQVSHFVCAEERKTLH